MGNVGNGGRFVIIFGRFAATKMRLAAGSNQPVLSMSNPGSSPKLAARVGDRIVDEMKEEVSPKRQESGPNKHRVVDQEIEEQSNTFRSKEEDKSVSKHWSTHEMDFAHQRPLRESRGQKCFCGLRFVI